MMEENWGDFWSFWDDTSTRKLLYNTYYSARTKKIDMRIKEHFGSFEDLEVIELGSGTGSQSLVMALKGARVTLVDRADEALNVATKFFKKFGLTPTCIKADMFNLDGSFTGKFDVSMSFGTVEHSLHDFQRKEAIKIHYKVLKKGGVSFVSVPNRMCVHHRLATLLVRMIHSEQIFKIPPHKPFDTPELIGYAREVGFKHYETFGSTLFDFDYLTPYLFTPVQAQITTPFDNFFAWSLVLFGVK
jgi:2-polyprenyl-3-methyl-5-hydroxy-6-metoxy-1,4-benzoquinol methylase